jgi:hypothetical protein
MFHLYARLGIEGDLKRFRVALSIVLSVSRMRASIKAKMSGHRNGIPFAAT